MNSAAAKTGKNIALSLILVVSLVGNSLMGIIVYKTPNLRKPINFLIANMTLSDLLYPIFLFPSRLTLLHLDGWLIGGPLGQALCKLPSFLADASTLVSVQSLILIIVDRFQATVVQLRSPLISRKFCPFVPSSFFLPHGWGGWPFIRHILLLSNLLNTQRAWSVRNGGRKPSEKLRIVTTFLQLLLSCFSTSHLFCSCYFTPSSCSVILGELEAFRNYKGFSIISRTF